MLAPKNSVQQTVVLLRTCVEFKKIALGYEFGSNLICYTVATGGFPYKVEEVTSNRKLENAPPPKGEKRMAVMATDQIRLLDAFAFLQISNSACASMCSPARLSGTKPFPLAGFASAMSAFVHAFTKTEKRLFQLT